MIMRMYAICCFCMGNILTEQDVSPVLIDRKHGHELTYDLKTEYHVPKFYPLSRKINIRCYVHQSV